jgi:predicted TIM-barrel fold metal-dependent hydrolase
MPLSDNHLAGLSPIINIHAHIFPDKIQTRAVESIRTFYDLPMSKSGQTKELLSEAAQFSVEKTVVFSTATARSQVRSIHAFIRDTVSMAPDALIGFGTLHPEMTPAEIEEEITVITEWGLKGVKLHPDFQKIPADDPVVHSIASKLQGKLPILIHAGDYRFSYSHPEQIARLAKDHPNLTIVAAHFGGWSEWYKAPEHLAGLSNVYVDTSSSLAFLSKEKARELITVFGADHVVFGTDYPMWSLEKELNLISELGLSDSELHKILFENATKILY